MSRSYLLYVEFVGWVQIRKRLKNKMFYVVCQCGNMVQVKKRHDFSVLPCPECRK